MPTPEELARQNIDRQLSAAGWAVQDRQALNLYAGRGQAVREYPLQTGEADYLLFVDRKAVGVIEAKPAGATLSGAAEQAGLYAVGLPAHLPHVTPPLPFQYESTGVETLFRDNRDPQPRSRPLFTFHRPETLAEWIAPDPPAGDTPRPPVGADLRVGPDPRVGDTPGAHAGAPLPAGAATLRARLQTLPPLDPAWTTGMWPAQVEAVANLERSLALDRPRALIQSAGRAFTDAQRWWLDRIAEHIGVNLAVAAEDLERGVFYERGGWFGAKRAFGDGVGAMLEEMNAALGE